MINTRPLKSESRSKPFSSPRILLLGQRLESSQLENPASPYPVQSPNLSDLILFQRSETLYLGFL